jgi:hypothetical protein
MVRRRYFSRNCSLALVNGMGQIFLKNPSSRCVRAFVTI